MRDLTSSDSGSPSRVATTQLQHPAATPGEERRGREEELEPHQATICRPARPRWVWSVNAWQTIRYKKLKQHFFFKIGDQKKHPEPEVSEEEREAGGSGGPGLSPLRSDGGGNPSPLRGGRRSLPAGSSSPCALTSNGLVVLLILLGFPLVRT